MPRSIGDMNYFKVAFRALRSNRLRSGLTIAVMIIGIASIVGIQSALTIISDRVSESFGKMGTSIFTIEIEEESEPITYTDAVGFKDEFFTKAAVSATVCSTSTIRHDEYATDPVVTVVAADENYLLYQMGEIASGRMLNKSDVASSGRVAVIGNNVSEKLFRKDDFAGAEISVDGLRFTVVGVIRRQGSMLGMGLDNMVIVPYTAARAVNLVPETYSVAVIPEIDEMALSDICRAAESLMMQIRRTSEKDFRISFSDSAQDKLLKIKQKLSMATLIIGMIALFGAVVSLMNIMLVSVKERKMEIGVKKALGASSKVIAMEFLAEAATIGVVGGCLGIVVGILFGKASALLMDSEMIMPWDWMAYSVICSVAVGLMSGWLPARLAAATDPVESLRDE